MKINYRSFKKAIKEKKYEDAFYILFMMIKNLDPNAIKADAEWTALMRNNNNVETIKKLEEKISSLPKGVREEMELKYSQLFE